MLADRIPSDVVHGPEYTTGAYAWSPDGQQIAFTSGSGANQDLHIVRTDGSSRDRAITSGPKSDCCAAWSPDGANVAFLRGDGPLLWDTDTTAQQPDRRGVPMIANADGSDARELVDWTVSAAPVWSPDGTMLAVEGNKDGTISFVDVATGEIRSTLAGHSVAFEPLQP